MTNDDTLVAPGSDVVVKGEPMKTRSPNQRIAFGAGLAVVLVVAMAFATSATGGSPDPAREIVKLKRDVATLKSTTAADRSELRFINVASRVAFVEAAGIHAMEGKYNTSGLTTRDVTAVQNVLTVVSNAKWPAALTPAATDLRTKCKAFLDTWKAGDKAAAFPQLQAAHEAYHALGAEAWTWLAQQAK